MSITIEPNLLYEADVEDLGFVFSANLVVS